MSRGYFYVIVFLVVVATSETASPHASVEVIDGDLSVVLNARLVQRDQAERICRENRSRLARIDEPRVQRLINLRVGKIPLDVGDFPLRLFVGFWTAGRQLTRDDRWRWDAETGMGWTNWIGHSPVISTFPSCIYVYPFSRLSYGPERTGDGNDVTQASSATFTATSGGWLNKPCNMRSYFICTRTVQKPKAVTSEKIVVPIVVVASCLAVAAVAIVVFRRRRRRDGGPKRHDRHHQQQQQRHPPTVVNDTWMRPHQQHDHDGDVINNVTNKTYENSINIQLSTRNDVRGSQRLLRLQIDDDDHDDFHQTRRPSFDFEHDPSDYRDYDDVPAAASLSRINDVTSQRHHQSHDDDFSSDSYHTSDLEDYDHPPIEPPPRQNQDEEQIYASIESLHDRVNTLPLPPCPPVSRNNMNRSHHQMSLHKVTAFPPRNRTEKTAAEIDRMMAQREPFPLPHEATFPRANNNSGSSRKPNIFATVNTRAKTNFSGGVASNRIT